MSSENVTKISIVQKILILNVVPKGMAQIITSAIARHKERGTIIRKSTVNTRHIRVMKIHDPKLRRKFEAW